MNFLKCWIGILKHGFHVNLLFHGHADLTLPMPVEMLIFLLPNWGRPIIRQNQT